MVRVCCCLYTIYVSDHGMYVLSRWSSSQLHMCVCVMSRLSLAHGRPIECAPPVLKVQMLGL